MRQNHRLIDKHFVLDLDVLCDDWDAFDSDPMANHALPADNRVSDECMGFDFGLAKNGGIWNAAATSDLAVGADHDVRSDDCVFVNLGRRVNHYVTDDVRPLRQKDVLFVGDKFV